MGQICVFSFMNGPKEILSHASHEAAHVKMTLRNIVTLILAIVKDIGKLIRLSTFSELTRILTMSNQARPAYSYPVEESFDEKSFHLEN